MQGWKLIVMTIIMVIVAAVWSSLMFKQSVTVYQLGVGENLEAIESQVQE